MSSTLCRLDPSTLPDATAAGYSQLTVVPPGSLVFISGQVAWTRDGGPVPGGLVEQAAVVVENVRAALSAARVTPSDVAMVRVYLVDLTPARQAALMPVLLELFDGRLPSLTGVGVAALAAPELQLEVELVARVPDDV